MKKILSAVLAAMMLSTVAMAANYQLSMLNNAESVAPGDKLYLRDSDFGVDAASDWEFNEDYFAVTTKKITTGAGMVDSITFDVISDDEALVLKLEKSDDTDEVKKPNLVIEEISIRARKDGENFEYRDEFTYDTEVKLIVANTVTDSNAIDIEDVPNNTFVEVDVDSYEEAEYQMNDILMYGRVYDGDIFKIDTDNDYNKALTMANEDAELEFYNIAVYGLASAWTVEIPADEDSYIYEVDEDGKLTKTSFAWDDDVWAFVGKTRTSVNLVVSDMELASAPATSTGTTTNPDTGAADVVGVAAALAVVSLVAAAAVSMKKK